MRGLPLPDPAPGYRWGEDELGIHLRGPERVVSYVYLHHSLPSLFPAPPFPPRLSTISAEELSHRAARARGNYPKRFFLSPLAYEEAGPGLGLYLGPGCTYRCAVCSTGPFTFRGEGGREAPSPEVAARDISETIDALRKEGFFLGSPWLVVLGGEPTLFLPYLLRLLAHVVSLHSQKGEEPPRLSLVTNGHFGEDTAQLLAGVPDAYVLTLRAESGCARNLGVPEDHVSVVLNTLSRLQRLDPQGRFLVRVWVAAGHEECCAKSLLRRLYPFEGRVWALPTSVLPLNARGNIDGKVSVRSMPDREKLDGILQEAKRFGLLPLLSPYPNPLTEGERLLQERRFQEALLHLSQAVVINPLDPTPRLLRGWARLGAGDPFGARLDAQHLFLLGREAEAGRLEEKARQTRPSLLWFATAYLGSNSP